MKRSGIFLMVLFFAVLAVTGISAGGKQDTGNKPTVIRVWGNDAHNKDEYVKVIDAFNAGPGAAKNIRIEYTVYGGDFQTALDIAITAGEEPEMYNSNPKIQQYYEMGKVVPLTELPGFQDILDAYAPYQKEGFTVFGGKPYVIPLYQNVYGMAYNKELLARAGYSKPPATWDEYAAVSIAISKLEPGKIFGTGYPCKFFYYHENHIMSSVVSSTGHFQFDFTTGRYKFTDLVPYFEMLNKIRNGGGMFPGIETLDDDTLRAQFSEGNVGLLIGGSWNVGVLYDQFPAKFEWGVAPIPVKDPKNSYNGYASAGALYAVSNKCRDKGILDKVAEVYRILAGKDLRTIAYSAGKDIPIVTQYVNDAPPSVRPQWNDYAKIGANAVLRSNFPDSVFTLEGDNMYTVFTKIITGTADPASALADLEKRYNEALDKAIANKTINIQEYIDPSVAAKFKVGH
jgi:multiple sugar transport system substrate-binding protein